MVESDKGGRTKNSKKPVADHILKTGQIPTLAEYTRLTASLESLRQEVVFILDSIEIETGIKTHAVESRVKSYNSLVGKMSLPDHQKISDVIDMVGCRVICLFKSDLDRIVEFIRSRFEIVSLDNKIEESTDSFGYMSIHCVCVMKTEYIGPRYDRIAQIPFEIQIRTLCMHAWAAISHYLDYKTELDIPIQLRKGLNALSGLFYVADAQYEELYKSRQTSRDETMSHSVNTDDDSRQLINFDTVDVMLERLFPDRSANSSEYLSRFVAEIIHNGFIYIDEVEDKIVEGIPAMNVEEVDMKKHNTFDGNHFLTRLGAARVALRKSMQLFNNLNYSDLRKL